MANVRITELPIATSLLQTDVLPAISSSTTSQITLQNLASSLPASQVSSSYPIAVSGSTLYSTNPASVIPSGGALQDSILLGTDAGLGISNLAIDYVVYMGKEAGYQALNSFASIFIGSFAGKNATNATYGTFVGIGAGQDSTNAQASVFLGADAGGSATNASQSFFAGQNAGRYAANAHNSNFFGRAAGNNATSASYSTLIGYFAGYNPFQNNLNGISSNNIIIGTNITLAANTKDSINLGGIIFATGSHSNAELTSPFSGSMTNAKVGINKSLPEYTFDVSGSGNYSNELTVSGSLALKPQNPLPTGFLGMLAVSSSEDLYFHNGTDWKAVQLAP